MIPTVNMDTSQSFSFSMDNQRLASIGAEATGPAMHHPRGASRNLPSEMHTLETFLNREQQQGGGAGRYWYSWIPWFYYLVKLQKSIKI